MFPYSEHTLKIKQDFLNIQYLSLTLPLAERQEHPGREHCRQRRHQRVVQVSHGYLIGWLFIWLVTQLVRYLIGWLLNWSVT